MEGDLITLAKQGHFNAIIHGCNCFNTMGAGIAKQIASEFPGALTADRATVAGDPSKLGGYTFGMWFNATDTVNSEMHMLRVFNAYTQYNYRRSGTPNVDYDAIRSSLLGIKDQLDIRDKIGIPLIGCGLAGGDWNVVSKIVNDILTDFDVTVVTLPR